MVKTIRRTMRLFDIEARERTESERWRRIEFLEVAKSIQQLAVKAEQEPSRYYDSKDGERWYVDFPKISQSTNAKVLGVCFRGRQEDLPVLEVDGSYNSIPRKKGESVTEINVFGVFDNTRLVFQVSRHGLSAGQLGIYLKEKLNEIHRINGTGKVFDVDIIISRKDTFEKVMREAEKFTRIHMRPKYDLIGALNIPRNDRSELGLIRDLMERIRRSVELKASAGRWPSENDAFLEGFANWAREHMSLLKGNEYFEILEGSAMLRTGEIRAFDIMNRHLYEKKVGLRQTEGEFLDIEYALGKLEGVYKELREKMDRE